MCVEVRDYQPQLAISHHHSREIIGSRNHSTLRDAGSSLNSPEPDQACRFTPYETLTNNIPLTAAQPVKIRTRSSTATGASFLHRDSGGKLDPSILDSIIWSRIHETRRNFLLCKYEVGGGICADDTCGDLHMSRDVVPTREKYTRLLRHGGQRGELVFRQRLHQDPAMLIPSFAHSQVDRLKFCCSFV